MEIVFRRLAYYEVDVNLVRQWGKSTCPIIAGNPRLHSYGASTVPSFRNGEPYVLACEVEATTQVDYFPHNRKVEPSKA